MRRRNTSKCNHREFDVALSQDETSDKYIKNYWYTCGIIGRVYDGYVVHDSNPDGSGAENEPLFRKLTGVYSSDGRVISANGQSRSYEIVNGAYLKQGGGKISWQQSQALQMPSLQFRMQSNYRLYPWH